MLLSCRGSRFIRDYLNRRVGRVQLGIQHFFWILPPPLTFNQSSIFKHLSPQGNILRPHIFSQSNIIFLTLSDSFLHSASLPLEQHLQDLPLQLQDPTKHTCEQCGRVYKQKCTLTFHQRYECNQDPQFACELCPYKAKRKTSLNSHIVFRHKDVLLK